MTRSKLIITTACYVASVAGCVVPSKPFALPTGEYVVLVDKAGGSIAPYPSVNLRVVASTPVHIWADPDYAQFTNFRFRDLEVLNGPGAIARGERGGGGLYPLLVWQESGDNIIFAPGFNPVAIVGDTGIDDAYGRIRRLTKQHGDLDADFLDAEKKPQSSSAATDKQLTIGLVPLCLDGSDRGILVDHSMLVFLLSLDDVWDNLRKQHSRPDKREAVRIVCRTVADIGRAHGQKWPSYKWSNEQRRILDWCELIATGE